MKSNKQNWYPENVVEVLSENGGRETLFDLVIPLNGLFEGLAFEDVDNGSKSFAMDNWNEKTTKIQFHYDMGLRKVLKNCHELFEWTPIINLHNKST